MNCTTRGLFKNSYCPNNWPSCISSAVATTSCLSSGRAHALSPPTPISHPTEGPLTHSLWPAASAVALQQHLHRLPLYSSKNKLVADWAWLLCCFSPNKLSCHGWSSQICLSGAFDKAPKYNWCCALHQIFSGNPVPRHNPWGLHSW